MCLWVRCAQLTGLIRVFASSSSAWQTDSDSIKIQFVIHRTTAAWILCFETSANPSTSSRDKNRNATKMLTTTTIAAAATEGNRRRQMTEYVLCNVQIKCKLRCCCRWCRFLLRRWRRQQRAQMAKTLIINGNWLPPNWVRLYPFHFDGCFTGPCSVDDLMRSTWQQFREFATTKHKTSSESSFFFLCRWEKRPAEKIGSTIILSVQRPFLLRPQRLSFTRER